MTKADLQGTIRDRSTHPDRRAGTSSGPRYAFEVDRGYQAPVILGEGETPEEARAQAAKFEDPSPRKPSYEELETSAQTRDHIDIVRKLLRLFAMELTQRGETHDQSKLSRAEVDVYTEFTPKLKGIEYGSEEYKACLAAMAPALKHHYAHNRHHPEFFEEGLDGMNLIDLLEMYVDWVASGKRHAGDIRKSIEISKARFKMSDQLAAIFANTARDYPL